MRSLLPFAAVGGLAGLLLVLPPADPVRGCGMAFHPGERIGVASESAVIVWDEAAKTEHFIRRAQFRAAATSADFGFLVPTPSAPEVKEAPDSVFRTLEVATAPRVEYRTETISGGLGCSGASSAAPKAAADAAYLPPAGAVNVLKQDRVGQFDYAVLKADDPKALRDWLDGHGYQARPELVAWLKAYTENKWVLTAFKIAGQPHGVPGPPKPPAAPTAPAAPGSLNPTAVRMSFKTDKPFYPYREPEDMRKTTDPGSRLLRVYFFADKRFAGTLGTAGDWPGRAVWSKSAAVPAIDEVKIDAGRAWRLTEFEDRSYPRPGTDEVYFSPAADQAEVERPPVVHTTYVVDAAKDRMTLLGLAAGAALIPLTAIAGVYLLWRLTRRKNAAPA